eukprot:gnl/TRDRNA2_/TRDRNA2_71854_c0_seq1.p2 gnl/TRDRNA2_/TRDRNA2_71854_c0~~gnl/TRDRNA2_/TRDRNA2_71854_c0_seq1.p2  ORF type:complete len:183 (-),score=31.70 gnl/TRDRNA2_/TRDRNA2_71854_c0_seq1:58-606(-)
MARVLRRQPELCDEVWCEDIAETAPKRAAAGEGNFSLVALLNVLDRCASPRRLLSAVHRLLAAPPGCSSRSAAGGLLLLATPLPFRPAYFGWSTWFSGRPLEGLGLTSSSKSTTASDMASDIAFAEHSLQLLEDVLPAAGFEPVAVSRVPYLSAGDAFNPFWELDDLIVLARRVASDSTQCE